MVRKARWEFLLAIGLAGFVVCIGLLLRVQTTHAQTHKRFETKVVFTSYGWAHTLGQLGLEGWEVKAMDQTTTVLQREVR